MSSKHQKKSMIKAFLKNPSSDTIDRFYRPGALWKTRNYIYGSGANGEGISIKPGVVVLVLEYRYATWAEWVVLLAGDKLVLIEDLDLAHEFDMEPQNKTK